MSVNHSGSQFSHPDSESAAIRSFRMDEIAKDAIRFMKAFTSIPVRYQKLSFKLINEQSNESMLVEDNCFTTTVIPFDSNGNKRASIAHYKIHSPKAAV